MERSRIEVPAAARALLMPGSKKGERIRAEVKLTDEQGVLHPFYLLRPWAIWVIEAIREDE
jgi:hypothetical protein